MTSRKTTVDENTCIGCGMCVSLCQKVYQLREDTGKAYIGNPEAFAQVTEEELEETKVSCPVGAIDFIND